MSQRTVHFSSRPTLTPRSPNVAELNTLKCLSRHVKRCQVCSVSETRTKYSLNFCQRGNDYGIDILPYLAYEHGRCISVVDYEQGLGRTEVIIPDQYKDSEIYLRYKAAQGRRRSNQQTRQTIAVPPITLMPEISRVQESANPGEILLRLTIPSFTIPVRICSDYR